MEAREREMSLRLHPGRGEYREVPTAGQLRGLSEEPGLADSWLPTQHEGTAAGVDSVE
jgi:hypothetical protein